MSKSMADEARARAVAGGARVAEAPEVPKPAPGETFENEPIVLPEDEPAPPEAAEKTDGEPEVDPIESRPRIPAPDPKRRPPAFFPPNLIPKMRFPKGLDVVFLRIPAELTSSIHKGDRYLICWELSSGDDVFAYDRAGGSIQKAIRERVKQMIRAVDGHVVTWAGGGPADVDVLWEDIGAKGRDLLHRLFNQLHVVGPEDIARFFETSIGLVRMA